MKALKTIVLATLLIASPFAAAADDSENDNSFEGSIELGGMMTDLDGSPDMAAEYSTLEEGVVGKVKMTSYQDWGAFDLKFKYMAEDQFAGDLDFDIKRMVRSHNTYTKFPHRLGHEPMAFLESTSTNGKVVRHTDMSPDQDYVMDYSVFFDRTEFQFPGFRPLTLAVEFREQRRNGHTQAFTTNHCDNCHVKSQSHRRDQKTADGTLEASIGWKRGSVRARFTDRSLREAHTSVNGTFDKNLHPEAQTPVFDNRMQYDSDVGLVPVDLKPEIDKNTTRLDFRYATDNGFAITANGVWSETENRGSGNQAEYSGYVVTAAKRFGNHLRLRWRGKVYQTETDNVFIDTIERITPAGPQAGTTYYDTYGDNFDHTRYSVLNRDGLESKLEGSYRFGRKLGTLRGYWNFKEIDRDFFEVAPGERKTTSNVLGLSYRVRPAKGLRFDAELKAGEISDAFMIVDGTCSTLVSDRYANPWSPETPQYYDQHQTRIGDGTASASSWNEVAASVGWNFGQSSLTGRVGYWDGDNRDGDLTDWSKERTTANITFWSPGGENWSWYAAWAYQDMTLGSHVCVPVFDG